MSKEYTEFVKGYWAPPEPDLSDPQKFKKNWNILYASNSMAGEAGETADAVKKYIKGKGTDTNILLEMGDTLYYLEALASELGYTLDDVIVMNKDKLNKRFSKTGAYGN